MWAKIVYVPTGPKTISFGFISAIAIAVVVSMYFCFFFFFISYSFLFLFHFACVWVCYFFLFFLSCRQTDRVVCCSIPFRMQGKSWRTAIFYSKLVCINSNTAHTQTHTHTRPYIYRTYTDRAHTHIHKHQCTGISFVTSTLFVYSLIHCVDVQFSALTTFNQSGVFYSNHCVPTSHMKYWR